MTMQVNGESTPATTPKSADKPSALATTSDTQGMNAYASSANFEAGIRMAKSLAAGTMVPTQYQNNISNCLIAMELASRVGASVFAVMQNLDIIHGRPGWRGTFLIATVNGSKRFTPIRFRWEEDGQPTTPTNINKRKDSFGCRAVAKDSETGEELVGALITWEMVKAEGWNSKSGSKWKTMPEQMFMYRAGAFWTRVYSPETSLGMQTQEEVFDTVGYEVKDSPVRLQSADLLSLEAELLNKPSEPKSAPAIQHDDDGRIDSQREPGEEG
jgi:hypothetical protein